MDKEQAKSKKSFNYIKAEEETGYRNHLKYHPTGAKKHGCRLSGNGHIPMSPDVGGISLEYFTFADSPGFKPLKKRKT